MSARLLEDGGKTPPLDLDHQAMRDIGHQVLEFVTSHLATLRDQPAFSTLDRRSADRLLPWDPPEQPTAFADVLATFRDRVAPHHAREPHPRFLGYIPSCPTFPAVMGDWIATGFNFFAGVWPVSAGPNEIELIVLEWFRRWMGMPDGTRGLLTSGGSAATVTAVVAARHAALGADAARIDLPAPPSADNAAPAFGLVFLDPPYRLLAARTPDPPARTARVRAARPRRC